MNKIIINNSSIDYYKDYLSDLDNENLKKELENLFIKFKNQDNYIQNKSNDTHQALWFGPVDYKYGKYKNLKATDMPELILKIGKDLSFEQGYDYNYFNSVYINKYINSGIGYHHDNDDIFKIDKSKDGGKDIIVAVISLCANSNISIADNNKNFITSINVENNSLYIMNENFQNNLLHKVGNSNGIRYSLTFRHCV